MFSLNKITDSGQASQQDLRDLYEQYKRTAKQFEDNGQYVEAAHVRVRVARQLWLAAKQEGSTGRGQLAETLAKRWSQEELVTVDPETFRVDTDDRDGEATRSAGGAANDDDTERLAEVKEPSIGPDALVGEEVRGVLQEILDRIEVARDAPEDSPIHDPRKNLFNALLHGRQGTGKSLLAEALAYKLQQEGDYAFIPIDGSKIKDHRYNKSSERMRRLLDEADELDETAIVFIDEIDDVATQSEHEATAAVARVLRTATEGPDSVDDVVIIGATNQPNKVDTAVKGRFETYKVPVPPKKDLLRLVNKALVPKYRAFSPQELLQLDTDFFEGLTGRDVDSAVKDAYRAAKSRMKNNSGPAQVTVGDLETALRKQRQGKADTSEDHLADDGLPTFPAQD